MNAPYRHKTDMPQWCWMSALGGKADVVRSPGATLPFDPRRTWVSRHSSNEELSPHSGRGLLRRRALGDAKSTPSVYNPLLLFGHDRIGRGNEPFESFNRKSGLFSQILGQAYAGRFVFSDAEVGRRKPQRRVRIRGVCLASFWKPFHRSAIICDVQRCVSCIEIEDLNVGLRRGQLKRLLDVPERFSCASCSSFGGSKFTVGGIEIGIQRERVFERSDSLVHFAERPRDCTADDVPGSISGIEPDRTIYGLAGLRQGR